MTAPIDLEALRAALAAGTRAGPWFAVSAARNSLAWRVTLTPDDARGDICNVLGGLGNESPEATARVIAAVPEMLAELTTRRARDAEVEALVAACRLARSYMSEAIEYETPCAKRDGATVDAALAPFTGATP
jgi:hypothetical protein